MSLLWPRSIRIFIAPSSVSVVQRRPRSRELHQEILECKATEGGAAWEAPIEALREWLGRQGKLASRAEVVLSNNFVSYLLLPWRAEISGEREERALAAARFQQVYGDISRNWIVRVSPQKPGAPLLSAAINRALIDTLGTLCASFDLRLSSIQPALMAACNPRRANFAANAWILLAEPGRILVGLQNDRQWRSLRSRPLNDNRVALAELIEQERLLLGIEQVEGKVYLHEWKGPLIDSADFPVERWSTLETVGIHA